jgi:hypothetical protein
MVDFNKIDTVAIPPGDIVKIIILNRWWDLQEAREFYYKHKFNNINQGFSSVRVRTKTLFETLQATLKRKLEEKEYLDLYKLCNSKNEEDLDNAYFKLNETLDKINLTKIDTREQVNRHRVEMSNKAQGYF